ncbi:zinc finger protein 335-like isoform X2 [Anneissia japonica]|nr:zinc finger protein 335-like isoform X2 [Anneissia japonica]
MAEETTDSIDGDIDMEMEEPADSDLIFKDVIELTSEAGDPVPDDPPENCGSVLHQDQNEVTDSSTVTKQNDLPPGIYVIGPNSKDPIPITTQGSALPTQKELVSAVSMAISLSVKPQQRKFNPNPEPINVYANTFICHACVHVAKNAEELKEHIASVHPKEQKFKCSVCNFVTSHRHKYNIHMKQHGRMDEIDEGDIFSCDKCDYQTIYRNDLGTHKMKHQGEKPYKCQHCDFQSIYRHSLIHHVSSKHDKIRPFKCKYCDHSTARRQDLLTHLGKHEEERRFKCDLCDYTTPYRPCFRAHMDRHLGNRPFKCEFEYCDFATTTKQNLKSHMLKHAEDKPFKCGFCSYAGTHKQQLLNHMERHDAAPPNPVKKVFKCLSCDYTTSHKFSFKRHSERHNENRTKPEKTYACPQCDYATGYKSSLKRHMAKHSDIKPFKCGHCEYSAINMTQMHVHIAKHTGLKPFKCDQCEYATANKQHLRAHMAKHSDLKLVCDKCGFMTAWKQRMRLHMKAHASGKVFTSRVIKKGFPKDLSVSEMEVDNPNNEALSQISDAIAAFQSGKQTFEIQSQDGETQQVYVINQGEADVDNEGAVVIVGNDFHEGTDQVHLVVGAENEMGTTVQYVIEDGLQMIQASSEAVSISNQDGTPTTLDTNGVPMHPSLVTTVNEVAAEETLTADT